MLMQGACKAENINEYSNRNSFYREFCTHHSNIGFTLYLPIREDKGQPRPPGAIARQASVAIAFEPYYTGGFNEASNYLFFFFFIRINIKKKGQIISFTWWDTGQLGFSYSYWLLGWALEF